MTGPTRLTVLICFAGAVLPPTAAAPQERTVIEQMIATQNPCAALQTEIGGITIGIDQLEEVALRTAKAELEGDRVRVSFVGRLACKTSGAAAISGNAAASVTADADLSLADCSLTGLSVNLSEFGGSLAPALELLAPALQQQISEMARPRLVEACRQFTAGAGS